MTATVAVVGTGAAGLTAALSASDAGARVRLFEKADTVGGTTALSGGAVWVPNNRYAAAAGLPDSRQESLDYLAALSFGLIDDDLAVALVDTGPVFLDWLELSTSLRFSVVAGYPDYHPESPGGLPAGGRTLDPGLCSYTELGEWADRVTPSGRYERLTLAETGLGGGTGRLPESVAAEREAEDLRGCGMALVGHLLKACLDRGIVPETGMRATDLVQTGRTVTGVRFDGPGDEVTVEADSVILASGGFEWNDELVRSFLRGPMTAPASLETCTGDGLLMAMRAGAALGNMREAWWIPCADVPRPGLSSRPYLINRERSLPGSIMVNRSGRRFTNEAANYNAIGGSFHVLDASDYGYPNLPAWLVFDQEYLDRYGFAHVAPGDPAPSWMVQAPTVDGLADTLGIDDEGLAHTIDRWNALVANGADEDYHRGRSAYDAWNGDRQGRNGAMSTLGQLSRGPFYAVEILSGSLGTRGGPRTDDRGRVLDTRGDVIDGLYAAGNVMASPTGMVYGGAGGTIGPAMVFGFLAGTTAATAVPKADLAAFAG